MKMCCPSGSKLIHCQFHETLYHEVYNNGLIGKPDVIIAFNSGLYDRGSEMQLGHLWGPTIALFFKHQNVPLICTSYSKTEAVEDLARLTSESEACGRKIKVLLERVENPFRSLQPFRLDGSVAYKNRFASVIIVESES